MPGAQSNTGRLALPRPDHVLLRFIRSVNGYSRGAVIEYPIGPAKSLLATGSVEIVHEREQPLLETATVERRNDVETADAPRRRKRR